MVDWNHTWALHINSGWFQLNHPRNLKSTGRNLKSTASSWNQPEALEINRKHLKSTGSTWNRPEISFSIFEFLKPIRTFFSKSNVDFFFNSNVLGIRTLQKHKKFSRISYQSCQNKINFQLCRHLQADLLCLILMKWTSLVNNYL